MKAEFEYNLNLVNGWSSIISEYRDYYINKSGQTRSKVLDFGILRLHSDKLYQDGKLFDYLNFVQVKRLQAFLIWNYNSLDRNDPQMLIKVIQAQESNYYNHDESKNIPPEQIVTLEKKSNY